MLKETIGYEPIFTIPVTLPEVRNIEPKAETEITLDGLINSFDLSLLTMPDELFDAFTVKMASKGISAESIPTSL